MCAAFFRWHFLSHRARPWWLLGYGLLSVFFIPLHRIHNYCNRGISSRAGKTFSVIISEPRNALGGQWFIGREILKPSSKFSLKISIERETLSWEGWNRNDFLEIHLTTEIIDLRQELVCVLVDLIDHKNNWHLSSLICSIIMSSPYHVVHLLHHKRTVSTSRRGCYRPTHHEFQAALGLWIPSIDKDDLFHLSYKIPIILLRVVCALSLWWQFFAP